MRIRPIPILLVGLLVIAALWAGGDSLQGQTEGPVHLATTHTLTWTTHKDAYVISAAPGQNYGTLDLLIVGRSGADTARSLVQFSLTGLPADAVIVDATLTLTGYTWPNLAATEVGELADYEIWTTALTGPWEELDVTWSNQPTFAHMGDPPTSIPGYTQGVPFEWDVTEAVRAWVAGYPNHGFMVHANETIAAQRWFASREIWIDGHQPRLTVRYTTALPTPTHTPTATNTPTRTPTATLTATPTATVTPTPHSCNVPITLFPHRDTYTDSQNPGQVYGQLDHLMLSSDGRREGATGDNMQHILMHFPVHNIVPPHMYIYSAELTLYPKAGHTGGPNAWWGSLATLADSFSEQETNWTNQPAIWHNYPLFEVPKVGALELDVTAMVRDWHAGVSQNYDFVLHSTWAIDEYQVSFHSRENPNSPKLVIHCGSAPPTATPTATLTPTATATRTPTATTTPLPPSTLDLSAGPIMVTQGLQDWQHSIPLFEGKRTIVRFFATAYDHGPQPLGCYQSLAKMEVYRGVWKVATLDPINTNWGGACVPTAQSYLDPHGSFDYELPSDLLNGTLTLKAEINPGCIWDSGMQRETNCANNKWENTVTFIPAPPLRLSLFSINYTLANGEQGTFPTYNQVMEQVNAMKNMYPVHYVQQRYSTLMIEMEHWKPGFNHINNLLVEQFLWDQVNGAGIFQTPGTGRVRYAGFTTYQIGNLAGKASGIPGGASVSNVMSSRFMFAHELGHNMGRHHTPQCDADTGCWGPICAPGFEHFPYSGGRISPVGHQYASGSILGLEFQPNGYLYIGPTAKDLMTYCFNDMWISKFTFDRIRSFMEDFAVQGAAEPQRLSRPRDYLMVSGSIDSRTLETELSPPFVLNSDLAFESSRGDYAIVLLDSRGTELVRHSFTPQRSVFGILGYGPEEDDESLLFTEMVPYHRSAAQLRVLGHGGGVLASLQAGVNPPQVTLLGPNGGEVLNRDPISITWRARDVDGDPLTFNVGYSADDGRTWQLIARGVTGSSVEVPASSVPASNRGRMQVWASDGLHTASDMSDDSFVVPNRPPMVEIIQPEDGRVVVAGQTVFFQALAYDVDLPDGVGLDVQWRSDLDGPLWQGAEFATDSLSVGTHRILVRVDDGAGGKRSAAVTVRVVASFDDLPRKRDQLGAYPESLYLYPLQGATSGNIYLHNVHNLTSIPWQALSDQKWLRLSRSSGETPDTLVASVDEDGLPPGVHTASVTIINSAAPTQQQVVEVQVRIEHELLPQCALPLIVK